MRTETSISLGTNCVPHWHIHRLRLGCDGRLPFDLATTPRADLLHMLATDFANVWAKNVGLYGTEYSFRLAHRSQSDVEPILESWERRVERFRALRDAGRPLRFVRLRRADESDDGTAIAAALREFGFSRFRVLLVDPEHPPSGAPWWGTTAYWDALLHPP